MDAARRRDPAVKTCLLPETTDIMLVSPPEAMRFPWRFLFDYLTLEHRTPQEVNGRCFRTLIVGAKVCLMPRLFGRGLPFELSIWIAMPTQPWGNVLNARNRVQYATRAARAVQP